MNKQILFSAILSLLVMAACTEEKQRPVIEFDFGNPTQSGSRYPSLHYTDDGSLFMSWLSRIDEEFYALAFSEYKDGRWDPPQTVHVGTDFFANWADFPSVVAMEGEVTALHWLKKIEGGPYAYNVQIAFPGRDGERWTHITPHLDGTPTEHGFVSMKPLSPDRVLAIWLDGRHTHSRGHDQYFDLELAMTLRSAIVGADGSIEFKRVVDEAVCDCCQTDLAMIDGGAIAVYRDRNEHEIRDISYVIYDLETNRWSEPASIHDDGWEIAACPVNGPRVAVSGNEIAVVWYTEAGENKQVKASFSTDGGESFSDPIRLGTHRVIGRVDVVASPENGFYAVWKEQDGSMARIYLQKLGDGRHLTEPIYIGSTDVGRSSGFPRIAATSEGLVLAYTQTEPHTRIRTALYRYENDDRFPAEES